MQCKAKAKSTQQRCRRRAVTGYTVCQVHGAGSPKKGRPGGRPIIHGRYSKRLPVGLQDRYEEARTDPELLSLRDDVALLDTRLSELVEKLDTGETQNLWSALKEIYHQLTDARARGKAREMAGALLTMGSLIEKGANQGEMWAEIAGTLDQRRKLVESERKRLIEMRQMITAERAMVLISALIDAVSRNVGDKRTVNAIAAEFRAIVGREDRFDAGGSGANPRGGAIELPTMDDALSGDQEQAG